MKQQIILAAVPGFLALMGLEIFWARRRQPDAYSLVDSIANLACGIGSQLTGLVFVLISEPVYETLARHAALFDLSTSPTLAWGVAFIGVDFLYYWFHRASHRVSLFWATHSVHHQSQWYNLSVALRQPWFGALTSAMFYLPLAVLGVPYGIYAANAAINLLYQYWIHTEAIGKLGPLEWVLNTPSHHRVHHGANPRYLDKNYGGTLILWDRLFGTFEPEVEKSVYGLVHPLRTWSAVRANVDPWMALVRLASKLRGLDRLQVWWMPPGWGTTITNAPDTRRETVPPRDAAVAFGLFFVTFVASLGVLVPGMFTSGVRWLLAGLIFATFAAIGSLLDGHRSTWRT